jgi:hypothetical protein
MQNNSGKKISNTIKVTAIQRTNRKKIEAALKQMERGLECNDRAGAAEPIEALRDMLGEL